MTNHYHLVVRIRDAGLSAGICELNGSFAKLTNRRLERSNHLFGRRFWSELIDTDEYLLKPADTPFSTPSVRARSTTRAAGAGAPSPQPSAMSMPLPFWRRTSSSRSSERDPVQARARFAAFIEAGRGRLGQLRVPGTAVRRWVARAVVPGTAVSRRPKV